MATGDVYEIALVGSQRSKNPTVVLGYRQVGSVTGDPMAALANGLVDVLSEYLGIWPTSFLWSVFRVRGVSNPADGMDLDVNVAGTGGGDAGPMQTAVVVSKKSGLVGRSRNGRMYLPAPIEAYAAEGVLTSAARSAIAGMAEAIRVLFDGETAIFQMVVISREPSLLSTDVSNLVVRPVLGTQRRRRPAN